MVRCWLMVKLRMNPKSTGYSGTPLAKKLEIRTNSRSYTKNTPETYLQLEVF